MFVAKKKKNLLGFLERLAKEHMVGFLINNFQWESFYRDQIGSNWESAEEENEVPL